MTGHCVIQPATGRQAGRGRPGRVSGSPMSPTTRSTRTSTPASRLPSPARSPSTARRAFVERIEGDHHNVVGISLAAAASTRRGPRRVLAATVGAVASAVRSRSVLGKGRCDVGRRSVGTWRRRLTGPDRSLLALVAFALVLTHLRAVGDAGRDRRRRLHQPRLRPDAVASTSSGACCRAVPSNTATSPANVIVTSAVAVVVRSPMAAMWIVTLARRSLLAVGLTAWAQLGGRSVVRLDRAGVHPRQPAAGLDRWAWRRPRR